ncbi:dipeptidase [Reichenbachiella carrageenanivorans]|uniref:Dipeptidase n=1 Tax=Reichenbachiella carrageenanivorans TaxID=2979869 RepID=A0ABY6D4Z9_9BACT|nr:dipeptidase [Reichenbachiella carrageenanivorans]UXX80869.1 dipeptidase [Reichenbachiella carrageenanivorans]
MKDLILNAALVVIVLTGCNPPPKETATTPPDLKTQAETLAHTYIITDGHIDLPYKLAKEGYMAKGEIPNLSGEIDGNFDYEKAHKGGLDAPFMSIYIPASLQKTAGASKALADSLITMVEQIATTYPKHFSLAGSPTEVQQNFEKGLISLPMGMENGSPLGDDLSNIKYFYERGIRYITLTHSKNNLICDSSYDPNRKWNGLSPFGQEVVREMNAQGIMVDVSHVSDSTFYQIMAMTDVPCIASHSSVRKFTPGFERNMSDDMIKMLAKKGGVIQINFGSTFLSQKSRQLYDSAKVALNTFKTEYPQASDSAITAFSNQWLIDHNFFADVKDAADHIDHVVQLVGIDYVGLGSDFDGVGNSLPTSLKTAADYPKLIAELLERGYTETDIEKICYKNVFRVWSATLSAAGKS